jgi:hypothetical protein
MSAYRAGILVNNFDEDRWGVELAAAREAGKLHKPTPISETHQKFTWATPGEMQYATQSDHANPNRNVLEKELLFGHGPGGEKNIDSMYTREYFPVYNYQYRNPKTVDPLALKPKTYLEKPAVGHSVPSTPRTRVEEPEYTTSYVASYTPRGTVQYTQRYVDQRGEFSRGLEKNFHRIGLRQPVTPRNMTPRGR